MRPPWIFALLLASSPALAAPPQPALDDPGASDFWRDVIDPHSQQVAALLTRARTVIAKAGDAPVGDDVELRQQYLGDAYGMLRYARKLSPENTDVLGLLGVTADELGKTRQALDALETCARLQGPERIAPAVSERLGLINLRLGRLDEAIRWLHYIANPLAGADSAAATVHLATALAIGGHMAHAIDTLTSALPPQTSYGSEAITLIGFALAVHYDRDDQPGAAFAAIDRLQGTLQQDLGPATQRALAAMRFAPAEDELYYHALLYEALGDLTEARADWALYAAVPGAAWRGRALDHVAAIDALRASPPPPARSLPAPQIQISRRHPAVTP